ncbi:hypothetical protein QJQ45_023646, partial [Haematococcus lacustris]
LSDRSLRTRPSYARTLPGRPMSQEADPALDFLSDAFDAQRALDTPGLRPPVPDVKPLDNLAKCRWLLPPEIPESLAGKDRNAKSGSEATREKHEQLKTKALSTIQRIEQSCTVSLAGVLACVKPGMPQDCLRRWQQQQQRVRVVTRHGCGVRGVAEGQLVAYDTFMNLVLRDVSEQYTVMTRVGAPLLQLLMHQLMPLPLHQPHHRSGALSGGKRMVRWARKQERRTRQLGQVFVKGDSIVCVSCAQSATGTGSGTALSVAAP